MTSSARTIFAWTEANSSIPREPLSKGWDSKTRREPFNTQQQQMIYIIYNLHLKRLKLLCPLHFLDLHLWFLQHLEFRYQNRIYRCRNRRLILCFPLPKGFGSFSLAVLPLELEEDVPPPFLKGPRVGYNLAPAILHKHHKASRKSPQLLIIMFTLLRSFLQRF